jgi:glycosyltransferase involved in cell wall biosynthesis
MDISFFVLLIFILLFLLQLIFYAGLLNFKKQGKLLVKESGSHPACIPVTVVICAKNEAHNLKKILPLFLAQKYEKYELVVVNDRSTDDTAVVLSHLKSQYPNLKIVNTTDTSTHLPGKRNALLQGVSAANYDWILLSDADCQPASKYWIKRMMDAGSESDVCLGYGDYESSSSLLNAMIRYDTFQIAHLYFGLAAAGIAYMGVGRNILYNKAFFLRHFKQSVVPGLVSGDDDLLITTLQQKTTFSYALSFNARTISNATSSWFDYLKQKRRHLTTAPYYSAHTWFLSVLYYTMLPGFYFFFFFMLFTQYWYIALMIFVLRYFLYYWNTGRAMQSHIKSVKYYFFPFFDLMIIATLGWASLLNLLKFKHDWR